MNKRILKLIVDGCLIECVICNDEKEVEDYIKDVEEGNEVLNKYDCYSCIEEIKATTDIDVDNMDVQEYFKK